MRSLPYAIRAWTVVSKPPRKQGKGRSPSALALPRYALVIDTETTIDPTQRLLFGAYRFLTRRDATPLRKGGWDCVAEGVIYADDLPASDPDGFAVLQRYVRERHADIAVGANSAREPDWRLGLCSRTEFAEGWWRRLGVPSGKRSEPAVLVFFNAPFDISRLAAGVKSARSDMRGGFSFQVMANPDGSRVPYRPDVVVKQIDSKRAVKKNRAVETGQSKIPGYDGHYLDLRTAVFALTGHSHTLASACEAYGLAAKTQTELGVVTADAIDYCRNDVAITADLFAAVVDDFETHPIGLQLTKAYSPASIAKSYLDAMGLTPLLGPGGAGADTPAWVLGAAMSAFYGGRAECRIRRTPVPVVLVDFTSMYPTVNALMGSWNLITADRIEIIDTATNTHRIQALLNDVDAETMFDPAAWPELLTLVQIAPNDDVLPVRAQYRQAEWSIGINHFTDTHRAHWYALSDLIASKILTGRAPKVVRAVTLRPHGQAQGLRSTRLRGEIDIDPRTADFFIHVVEQRQVRKRSHGEADPVQAFLKVLANSGSYGIYAELIAQDHPATVGVYCGDAEEPTTTVKVKRPEEPGRYCYPPLAACITAGARLMLALLEHQVTALGGHWAFCDTDSMAILATPEGGDLIECDGGPRTTSEGGAAVRALSVTQVETLRRKFNALNPYNRQIVPDLLKEEKIATCVAISAKRYALYHEHDGDIEIVKASEHGLGQLLDPADPDSPVTKDETGCRPWITDVWKTIITAITDGDRPQWSAWAAKAAHARLTISSMRLLHPFARWNDRKPYVDQIKPANFMLTATIDPLSLPSQLSADRVRLIAPYAPNATTGTEWVNLYDPDAGAVATTTSRGPGDDRAVVVKTYRQVLNEYSVHPEAKFLDHTGSPCHRGSRGLLFRDHLTAGPRAIIGKEANRIDEVEAGTLASDDALTIYDDGADDYLRHTILPALDHLNGRDLAKAVGCDRRTIDRIRAGQMPRPILYARLVDLANDRVRYM